MDKAKKELFKKISSHLTGRNALADLFRNDPVEISDLHPMNNNSKQKNTNVRSSITQYWTVTII
jgi:hypothetical protein